MEDISAAFDETEVPPLFEHMAAPPFSSLASRNTALFGRFREFDPVKLAATFGGLLTVPELQSNCLRLEVLVHLSLALGHGERKPNDALIKEAFGTLDEGWCGRCEDPAEDVFAASIATPRGNFRILEGTWESAAFFLQRFLNIVESMPVTSGYDFIRDCVYAILKLSDAVCERAKLIRNQIGNDIPAAALPDKIARQLSSIRRAVRFSHADLVKLNISTDHLAVFGFNPADRNGILKETIGHSTLERYPVISRNGEFVFAMPTAVSVAIRRFVIDRMDVAKMRPAFLNSLASEYAETFSRTHLGGASRGAPIEFQATKNGLFAGVLTKAERGRFLNFIFFVDTLEGFERSGFSGLNSIAKESESDVNAWIDQSYETAKKEKGFIDGVTLLISCGVGRGTACSFALTERPNWRVEFISAADLYTFSWIDGVKPIFLWQLFEAQDKVRSLGVHLQNMNGLLNMVAWMRALEGHLIPHAQLPDNFIENGGSAVIMIEQNGLRTLRHEVANCWDAHVELDVAGHWCRVRKESESLFEEDRKQPLYGAEEMLEGRRLPAVYVTDKRQWWGEIEVSDGTPGHSAYERWKMLTTWLCRAAPVLEQKFPELSDGPILCRVRFEADLGEVYEDIEKIGYLEAKSHLSVSVEAANRIIQISASSEYEHAHFHENNIAERALVETLVLGIALFAGRTLSSVEIDQLVTLIVPDNKARQTHMFRVRLFRDYVQASLPRSVAKIDSTDAATMKLALGWNVRQKSAGPIVEGKTECMSYLGSLVRSIEESLCGDLSLFDRLAMIRLCLRNHEAAAVDRERWRRTAAAVLSLHSDKEAAMDTIAEHDSELNAVFQATRLLIEVAICECPLTGGQIPSEWDLSKLMAKMIMIHQFGGWSDAIRWDVMEPRLRITPLGDVHAKLGFVHQIIAPFARTTNDQRVANAVEGYAKNLASPAPRSSVQNVLELDFLAAWENETGATLDEFRLFLDFLEDVGVKKGHAVFKVPRSSLINVKVNDAVLPEEKASALLDFLTLRSRQSWHNVPEGFDDRDRQPWRFRRRLSVLRRPLIQIDDTEDPTILVAPGLVREAVMYMLDNYHQGDFPVRQLKRPMKSWAGKARNQVGHEFGQEVAAKLKEMGWKTDSEVAITKLLREGFERDYGDVDVLAWNPATGRVLIIECKDLQYRKTYGEIAEQLADFRGEVGSDRKPDHLKRHLDRVDVISNHLPAVARYVEMESVDRVESHLVFKNPVPMEFALKHMSQQVSISIFDRIDKNF